VDGVKHTIIADEKLFCFDDFKSDENIMKNLFNNLLDYHPTFVQGDNDNLNKQHHARKQLDSKKKASKK